jgi:phenylacetate-coenzyme A ligase PaaK-like adenylate-forming protein
VTRLANARRLAAAMRLYRSRRALEFGSRDELERYQRERFAETVRHAVARSPLYRELYEGPSARSC